MFRYFLFHTTIPKYNWVCTTDRFCVDPFGKSCWLQHLFEETSSKFLKVIMHTTWIESIDMEEVDG